MKKIILLPVIILAILGPSSAQDSGRKKMRGRIMTINKDSFTAKIRRIQDSALIAQDSLTIENNNRVLTEISKESSKRTKKQKTQGILYIVFGAAMLGVLIFGLMRRRGKESR